MDKGSGEARRVSSAFRAIFMLFEVFLILRDSLLCVLLCNSVHFTVIYIDTNPSPTRENPNSDNKVQALLHLKSPICKLHLYTTIQTPKY